MKIEGEHILGKGNSLRKGPEGKDSVLPFRTKCRSVSVKEDRGGGRAEKEARSGREAILGSLDCSMKTQGIAENF